MEGTPGAWARGCSGSGAPLAACQGYRLPPPGLPASEFREQLDRGRDRTQLENPAPRPCAEGRLWSQPSEFRELRGGGRRPRDRQGPGPSVGLLAHPTGRREVCTRFRWEGYQPAPAPAPVRGAPSLSSVKGKELGRVADGKEAKEEPQRHRTAPWGHPK